MLVALRPSALLVSSLLFGCAAGRTPPHGSPSPSQSTALLPDGGTPGYPARHALLDDGELAARTSAIGAQLPEGYGDLKLHRTGLISRVHSLGEGASPTYVDRPQVFTSREVDRWRSFLVGHAALFGLEHGSIEVVADAAGRGLSVRSRGALAAEILRVRHPPSGAMAVSIATFSAWPYAEVPQAVIPRERALDGLVGRELKLRVSYEYAGPHCNGCQEGPPPRQPPPVRRRATAADFRIEEAVVPICRDVKQIEIRRVYVTRLEPVHRPPSPAVGWREMIHVELLPTGDAGAEPREHVARSRVIDAVTGEDLHGALWQAIDGLGPLCPAR